MIAKALIDSGSEATFVTRRLQRRLGLPTKPTSVQVTGVNSVISAQVSQTCEFTLAPVFIGSTALQLTGLVIPALTGNPARGTPLHRPDVDVGLRLADPEFYKGGDVDILIGGDFYPQIFKQ